MRDSCLCPMHMNETGNSRVLVVNCSLLATQVQFQRGRSIGRINTIVEACQSRVGIHLIGLGVDDSFWIHNQFGVCKQVDAYDVNQDP